jgi:hypothetical protein
MAVTFLPTNKVSGGDVKSPAMKAAIAAKRPKMRKARMAKKTKPLASENPSVKKSGNLPMIPTRLPLNTSQTPVALQKRGVSLY